MINHKRDIMAAITDLLPPTLRTSDAAGAEDAWV